MALFNRKKQSATSSVKKTGARVSGDHMVSRNLSSVLVKPRITEKAVRASERNVYVFEVRLDATKGDVKAAIQAGFNVTPVRIRMVKNVPRSRVSRRLGRVVKIAGSKKAYVHLKEGESINVM